MKEKHYLKVKFALTKDNSPAIYDFFWKYLPSVLNELKAKEVKIKIERLEPIDRIYTNLNKTEAELKGIFDNFAKAHHLIEEPALTFEKQKTTLKARLKTKDLSSLLQDYNTLFDLFFADLIIKADKKIMFDMMDGFSNNLLAIGEKPVLEKFKSLLKKRLPSTRFEYVDHKGGKA